MINYQAFVSSRSANLIEAGNPIGHTIKRPCLTEGLMRTATPRQCVMSERNFTFGLSINTHQRHTTTKYCCSISHVEIRNTYNNSNSEESKPHQGNDISANSKHNVPSNISTKALEGMNNLKLANQKLIDSATSLYEYFINAVTTTTLTIENSTKFLDEYISQKDLADYMGVSQRTIREYAKKYGIKRALHGKKVYYLKADFRNKIEIK